MKSIGKLVLCVLLGFNGVWAQQFTIQLSSKTNAAGSPFEYQVILPAAPEEVIKWPDFSGLQVMSGPNQMSSYQNINGQASSQFIISWVLISSNTGKFNIVAPKFKLNGKVYNGPSSTVDIVSSGTSNAAKTPNGNPKGAGSESIFVKTQISKTTLYVGESVEVIQKLYSPYPILAYQKPMQAEYLGFYSKPIGQEQNQLQNEQLDGRMYYTHTALRNQITALKPGKQILKTSTAQIIIRRETQRQSQNIFEQLFGGNTYDEVAVAVQAKPQTIEVLALPDLHKPQNFTGSVGDFNMNANISTSSLQVNEAFNIKINIEGQGNFNLVQLPKLMWTDSLEVYEPKISSTENSKTFDFTIVPRFPGKYHIAPILFSYFNPKTATYYTKSTPVFTLQVNGNVNAQANSWKAKSKSEPLISVSETQDIRYIEKTFNPVVHSNCIAYTWWYVLLNVCTGVLFLLQVPFIRNSMGFIFNKKPKNRIYTETEKAFRQLKHASVNQSLAFQNIIKIWDSYFLKINSYYNTQFHYTAHTPHSDLKLLYTDLCQNLENAQQFAYAKQADASNINDIIDQHLTLFKNIHTCIQHDLP